MTKFLKYNSMLPPLFLALIILIIPQLNNTELMESTQSSKAFGFLWGMLGYVMMLILITALNHKVLRIRITLIDILLGAFCIMEVISYWRNPGDQLKMLTFGGLIIFYLSVRALDLKYIHYLLIAIIISGAVQAIYGNLQLWGYYPSNHGLFKLTGSFFNPGPYAGYLAAILPVSLGVYLFGLPSGNTKPNIVLIKLIKYYNDVKSTLWDKLSKAHFIYNNYLNKSTIGEQEKDLTFTYSKILKFIALISIISICLVLPASRSRAAWLAVLVSSLYLISIKYQLVRKLKIYSGTNAKKLILLALIIFFVLISFTGLYYFKKGSADGRLLIWKVSTTMIKDKPLWGHGSDMFAASYMNYQAKYFKPNPDIPESIQADNVTYPYNELLKITVEKGVIGLLLGLCVIWSLFFKRNDSVDRTNLPPLVVKGGLLSLFVFAQFSYPSEILPIKMLFVLLAGVVTAYQNPIRIFQLHAKETALLRTVRYAALAIMLLMFYPARKYLMQQYQTYKTWKDASDIYNVGAYPECLVDFEKVYPNLKTNGVFLIQYGKALEMAKKYDNSIAILNGARLHLNNTILYSCLGKNYNALGNYSEAEYFYMHAWNMVPARIYPLYLLAKLYDETGQKGKAKELAKELLEKKIKIESTAILEMKQEMKKIIENSIINQK